MIMDDKECFIVCQRCGNCCAKGLDEGASINDIAIWIAAKRYDILEWVHPIISPISEVVVFDIWINPRTHEYSKCPWLRREKGKNKYSCAIHDIKPEVCRTFPVDMEDAKRRGCRACHEKLPGKEGKGGKVLKKRSDDD
jgi:uncharacterized protein